MSRASRISKVILCVVYVVAATLLPMVYFNPKTAEAASIIIAGTPTTATANSATSLVINKPTGVTSGDVMIAMIAVQGANPTITSTGWTSSGVKSTQGSTNVAVESFYLRAGGSEPSSYTFNISTSAAPLAGAIVNYRGVVATGNPIEATSTSNSGSSSSLTVNSVTPTTNESRIIGVYALSQSAARTFTPPTTAGVTERADTATSNGPGQNVSIEMTDYVQTTAGAFTPSATTASGTGDWATHQLSIKPDTTTHMMLFWDGTDSGGSSISLPSGWSYVTEAEGRFLRGEDTSNYGKTGGQNDHTHTMLTPTLGAPSATLTGLAGNNANSAVGHTHTMPTNTSVTATNGNIPSFKTLRLIRYDAGIPNTIPSGGIAIFDDSPGIPSSGWTRQSSQDGYMAKIDSSAGTTGGSDTHTHNITWSGNLTVGGAETINNFCLLINCAAMASSTHTHTVSTTQTTSDAASNVPPYIQPLLAKADSNTPVLSIGLTAMFDNAPGGGWVVRSDSGGAYYQKFLRPNSTYNQAGGGAPGHTPTGGAKTSGAASGTGQNGTNGGNNAAAAGHTHVITPVFQTYTSDSLYTSNNDYFLPPYYDVVVAEKVNFIFNHYAWYDDNGAIQVTSRYSGLDIAQDAHITPVPAGNNPPDIGQALRLRIQVLVNNSSLASGEMEFRLQYAVDKSTSLTTTTCTNSSLSWTDVGNNGGSEDWTYVAASGHPTDGTLLSSSGGTSIMSPTSDTLQRYVRSNAAGTNSGTVAAGQTMEWDYNIMDNAATPATQYRFRLVEDSGILLSQYGYGSPTVTPLCPTLVTKPYPDNQLRHGNFFDNTETEKGFFWVN